MTDTSSGPQRAKSEPDAKTKEERRYYKRAGIQKEGRTAKAYVKQYAPLKWKCSLCRNKESFSSKEQLEHHNLKAHNRDLPEMGA